MKSGVQYLTVIPSESGQKLMQFIDRRLQGQVPRSALLRWIRTGQVRVDKSRARPFVRIKTGQQIRIPPHTRQEKNLIQRDNKTNPFDLKIVYEDEKLLVLAKPPNLSTQPGSGVEDSVIDRVKLIYADYKWRPALVHRLDKPTSGLLILAKSYDYLQHLQKLWKKGLINKIYLAWLEGSTHWNTWEKIEDTLFLGEKNPTKVHKPKKVVARCLVKSLINKKGKSLVAINLLTGKKHQIRLQMAKRGSPVIGDTKYGKNKCGQGLLLHACHLSWEDHSFTLPPPWLDPFAVPQSFLDHILEA